MAGLAVALAKWTFTRPDPPEPGTGSQYFRTDMREIAGNAPNYDLPWDDNMYLAFPSLHKPDWPGFVAHVNQLNLEADKNTSYKIVYIMRRAHKPENDLTTPDPFIDDRGKQECQQLAAKLKRAMQTPTSIPSPEVIVTSPLARALETTKRALTPVFPSIRPIVLENLRERLNRSEKNKRHGKESIQASFPTFHTENVDAADSLGSKYAGSDEPVEDLSRRVQSVFAFIFENFRHAQVVALMSHCYVVQRIQREITGWDLPDTPEHERRDKVEFFVGDAQAYAIIVKGVRA